VVQVSTDGAGGADVTYIILNPEGVSGERACDDGNVVLAR